MHYVIVLTEQSRTISMEQINRMPRKAPQVLYFVYPSPWQYAKSTTRIAPNQHKLIRIQRNQYITSSHLPNYRNGAHHRMSQKNPTGITACIVSPMAICQIRHKNRPKTHTIPSEYSQINALCHHIYRTIAMEHINQLSQKRPTGTNDCIT